MYGTLKNKERADFKMIRNENNVLTDDEIAMIRGLLKVSKHACLYIRNEPPRGFKVLSHV